MAAIGGQAEGTTGTFGQFDSSYEDPDTADIDGTSSAGRGERQPLLGERGAADGRFDRSFRLHLSKSMSTEFGEPGRRNLTTFAGVFSPVALSMFSTVLFLRLGFVVGQAGLVQTLVQFGLAYLILYLTILSICAISTNGAIEGGGAYYMISRALGPEFGGSIGLLFFLANIFSCALYISGFVEGMTDNFGYHGSLVGDTQGVPVGRWWSYLYCTIVLALCLIVCLIGGAMFARTSVFTLLILVVCVLSVVVSFLFKKPMLVRYPQSNPYAPKDNSTNGTFHPSLNYTGLSEETFLTNVASGYTRDYLTGRIMDFAPVFAILFSSVTGIMNGANMSGELKEPGKSIPRGTLAAACFTLATYLLLSFLASLTCSRELLINNYNFLQPINFWPPFIVIGIFAATLSAALGNLIGASRVLEALAKDEVFWMILKPATIATAHGNPYVAVFISWGLVQMVLLIGSLNAIAPMASELFLLSYASTNLACLALQLASAPNFRPTFRYFSWHTCLLGLIGCVVMCFFINAIYASVAMVSCLVLAIVLHLRTFPQTWGSISQALIFHQVRKYLLMLDSRKDHIKFWRPQILLLVNNPRGSCDLIDFINDIKKSGLYILGHVKIGSLDSEECDPCQTEASSWIRLIGLVKVKAFLEMTLARSVREGVQHLIRVSGLGGMKPNTICFGFYDNTEPVDSFARWKERPKRKMRFYTSNEEGFDALESGLPLLRRVRQESNLTSHEYLQMINDVLKMRKNVCLFRNFHALNKKKIFDSARPMFIDVWPVNLFNPETANYFDTTCMFMLQLACILHMVPGWKTKTILRVFLCVEVQNEEAAGKERKLSLLLRQLRIPGHIKVIMWRHVTCLLQRGNLQSEALPGMSTEGATTGSSFMAPFSEEYTSQVNALVRSHCSNTGVLFCYLPRVPRDTDDYDSYVANLDLMSENLPPTVLVHGINTVTSTTL